MEIKLRVISGRLLLSQYSVSIHPKTCTKYSIPRNSYVRLSNKGKSVIVNVQIDDAVDIGSVAMDSRTHAHTLYVAHGDEVICQFVDIHSCTYNIKVKMVKDNSIINCPELTSILYVEPGYYIRCFEGIGLVIEGMGIYISKNLLKSDSKKENISLNEINKFNDRLKVNSPSDGENRIEDVYMNDVVMTPATINIDFCHMGIGGLKEEMTTLIHQVLISRIINKSMREKYMVKDIRGILLYGPPGTGKTLIARNIGKIIPNSVIKKINGPELTSKFYGETESNVRKIFDGAKCNPDKLHVVIFDEIDAIGRIRGDSSSNHDDKVLTQLITMIDGLDSANNVLVIGITNRKDVLDPALTRAGRLEYHIEIRLPTESGRKEILDIYLNPLRSNDLIRDINCDEWAQILDGYSGADIESLIGRAKNLALLRNCDVEDGSIKSTSDSNALTHLTHDDLLDAYKGFKPTFSRNDDIVQRYITNYPLIDPSLIVTFKQKIDPALNEPMTKPYILHRTERHEEDRALMCHLAHSLRLPYVRYVSYNEFLGKNSSQSCNILNDAYINCLQAERAVMIIDSLRDVGDRCLILRERFILSNPLPPGKQLIIIQITDI